MRPHLAKHIKHIRSTYGLGRAMQDCLWTKNAMRKAIDAGQPAMVERLSNSHMADLWTKMFNDTPAQAQIMLLLWLSPNVSELTLYTYDGPLSRILGLELSSNVPNFHKYAKLDTINIDGVNEDDDVAHPAYPEPESTLQPCRSLSDFRFRAANMAFDRMSEDEITHLDFVGICEALMPSKQTLRYLYLSMGNGPHTVRNVGTYNTLAAGTLKEFDRLETLIVPAAILTITSEKVDPDLENFHFQEDNLQIIDHLPASVVLLGLSNDQTGQFFEENDHKWLAREAAAQLARGLVQLPNLQAVHILESQSSQIVYPRELQDRCVEDEIDFVIEKWMEDDRLMVKHYGITT
ncbi:hypothetical protein J4E86_009906 [Alternaria arbusti]|uniref:uncharacterized protein n=1 Tax=Alternaria arbusti TaxID=232088 RepID=UPI00221FE0DA|nr:uncharacterized protein J4E86_009906 [Alternaria arbusti]KAI4942959.1 hypothetical protein J4E86_009906 [Alternaria arbusti]